MLVSTVNALRNQIPNTGRNFMTTYEFSHVAQNPNFYHRYPIQFSTTYLGWSDGGTSFDMALMKAMTIIAAFIRENTCFNLITDGLSSFTINKVNLFNAILRRVRRYGCKTCVRCYFIRRCIFCKPPSQFVNLCRRIGAKIITKTVSQFKAAFLADQKLAIKSIAK